MGDAVRIRVGLLLALVLAGCGRAYYRQAADRDAYSLIAQRIVSPEFDVGALRPRAVAAHRPHGQPG
jgi:hypothetical protein